MNDIFEDIIDSIEEGIVVFDKDERITLFNQASETILGISKKRALGSEGKVIFDRNRQSLEQVRKTFSSGQIISDYETYILKKDGSVIPVSLITSPIINSENLCKGIVFLIRDISRIKALEVEKRRADSLSTVGILAAGLAHEIKNPLGGIRGAAQLLEMEVGKNEELSAYTSLIIKETERVSSLLEELLDFANPKELNLTELNG